MRADSISLSADDPHAARALHARVETLAHGAGGPARLVVALDGERLSADFVAALVRCLRVMREFGGTIAIEVRTAAVRDALALHGLDRVFGMARWAGFHGASRRLA